MTATTIASTELSAERVQQAVAAVLEVLGSSETEEQRIALDAFHRRDGALIKRLSVGNLSDNYLKCLGYLVSAPKLTPNTDTILAEAARSAADFAREKTLKQLGSAIAKALNH